MSSTVTGRCARGSPILPSAESTQPRAVCARYSASVAVVAVDRRDLDAARRARARCSRCSLITLTLPRIATLTLRDCLRRSATRAPRRSSSESTSGKRLRRRDAGAIGQRDVPRRALEQRERGGRAGDGQPQRAIARAVRPAVSAWRSSERSRCELVALAHELDARCTVAMSPAGSSIGVRAGRRRERHDERALARRACTRDRRSTRARRDAAGPPRRRS